MTSTQFSIRLPEKQKAFLDNLAEATDSTRNHLITIAVSKMMDNYQFVLGKIELGDADIEAGRIVSMEDVQKRSQAAIDQAFKHRSPSDIKA